MGTKVPLAAALDQMKVDLIRWYVGGSLVTAFLVVALLKW
jgi:hypothetical protein